MSLDRPIIVVEVISPTNWQDDFENKVQEYFSVATIAHYLIVDADERVVLHHKRSQAGFEVQERRDGWIDLDRPGFRVAVHDLLGQT